MKRRWIRNGSNPRFFVLQDGKLAWYLNHTAGEGGSSARGSLIVGMDCSVTFDRAVSKQGLYKFEVQAGSNKVGVARCIRMAWHSFGYWPLAFCLSGFVFFRL